MVFKGKWKTGLSDIKSTIKYIFTCLVVPTLRCKSGLIRIICSGGMLRILAETELFSEIDLFGGNQVCIIILLPD